MRQPLIPARLSCLQPWDVFGQAASRTSASAALILQGEVPDKQDLKNLIFDGRHPKVLLPPLFELAYPRFTYLWNEDYFILLKKL